MSATAIVICIACQVLMVGGQLLLKRAMGARFRLGIMVAAIGCLSGWFFLWVGLMHGNDLSKLYPFEGLNPALIAIAASVVLKERMPVGAWVGLILVCVGIAVVAGT